MDIQTLFKQHPVAIVGVAGGLAIAGLTFLGKRGKQAATYPTVPLSGTGSGFWGNVLPPIPYTPPATWKDPGAFDPCNGPLAFLDPLCRGIQLQGPGSPPNPTPHPLPYPGPTPDPCGSIFSRYDPGCGPSPQPPPPPDPAGADYQYMKALDTAKSSMSMRMGVPWA